MSNSSAFCGFSIFCRTEIRPTPPCSPHLYCLLPIVAAAAAGCRSVVRVRRRFKGADACLQREAALRTASRRSEAAECLCDWVQPVPR